MTRVAVLAAALFSLAFGLSSGRAGQRQQDYADPMAAAFEALLKESRSSLQADIYCVATVPYGEMHGQRSDPSTALVTRLSAAHTNLRPSSKCVRRENKPVERFLEDSTGKQLMFVMLSCSHRVEGDTLVFQGSYHCGGRCGAGGTVRAWRAAGAWQARFVLEWIS